MTAEHNRRSDDVISFGPFKLFTSQRLLEKTGHRVRLGGRALDILIALTAQANEIVSREDLVAQVWPNMTVGDGSLRVQITALRKALGDGEGDARFVTTLSGRGYCFVAPVNRFHHAEPAMPSSATPEKTPKLPVRVARIVGRDEIIRTVSDQLENRRFVTIVGPGGIGKTTVAIAAAHHLLTSFGGAACFFDLGSLSDPLLVPNVIASALGLSVRSDDPVPGIIKFLQNRRMLLVLDNCEHVIAVTAALAERVHTEAPDVHILATSRESLRVSGEYLFRLPPLETPPAAKSSAEQALSFPAVRLFVDRMNAGGRRNELDDAEAPIVSEICHRLDGIALAIELAAGHVNTWGLQETLKLLSSRLDLLKGGRRTAVPRQQTLTATLDWSYELLSDVERLILRRLSVFAGKFTLEAALSVVADQQIDRPQIMTGLFSLIEKSLIAVSPEAAALRYRLLVTTRSYLAEKLAESGDIDSLRRRHAEFYRELFESIDYSSGSYIDHLDNVRAALEWSLSERGDVKVGAGLAAASSQMFLEMSLLTECQRWAERAIAGLDKTERGGRKEMKLQAALGQSLMFVRGNDDRARSFLVRALALAEELEDARSELRLLGRLALFNQRIGDTIGASRYVNRSAETAARLGDPTSLAEANWNVGFFNYYTGDLLNSEKFLRASLAQFAVSNADFGERDAGRDARARARCALAGVRWLRGFPEEATVIAKEALAEEATFSDPSTLCICFLFTGATFLRMGDLDEAERVIGRLISHARSYSFSPYEAAGKGYSGMLMISRGESAAGVQTLCEAIEMLRSNRQELHVPVLLGGLAKGLAITGRYDEALAAIDEVIFRAELNRESSFSLAEFFRLKGEILLSESESNSVVADEFFLQAIEHAVRQGSLSWQLRAATSLAQSYSLHNRHDDAKMILAPVYDRFTEGFQRDDLRAAQLLLDKVRLAKG